ncbi:UNVERIFIED_CONTAM: hypothetical protein K2H54_012841, partial [Gekko kuhli]
RTWCDPRIAHNPADTEKQCLSGDRIKEHSSLLGKNLILRLTIFSDPGMENGFQGQP